MESARYQLLTFIAYRALLVEQVPEINYSLPLTGDETDVGQFLRERHADIRVKSGDLPLKRVNRKYGLPGRKPQHGRNMRACADEVRIHLRSKDVEQVVAEHIRRLGYASAVKALPFAERISDRAFDHIAYAMMIDHAKPARAPLLFRRAQNRFGLLIVVRYGKQSDSVT